MKNSRLIPVFTILGATMSLFAADTKWENADGGNFDDVSNWSAGVPTAADRALFETAGTYTIHLDEDRNISSLRMNGGSGGKTITFDLGGYDFTVSSTDFGDFIIEGSAAGSSTFRVINGHFTGDRLRVNSASGSGESATIIVEQGGVLEIGITGDSRIANSGTGRVEVRGNGQLLSRSALYLGNSASSHGTLVVDGGDAKVEATTIIVGSQEYGHLQLLNGAQTTLSSHLRLMSSDDVTGLRARVEVGSGSELVVGGEIVVGLSGAEGYTYTTISDNAQVSATRFTMHSGNILEINGGTLQALVSGVEINRMYQGSTYRVFLNDVADTPIELSKLWLDRNVILDVQLGSEFTAELGGIYSIVDYSEQLLGTFVDTEGNALANGNEIVVDGYVFRLDYGNGTDGVVGLELIAIPEPSSFAAIAAALIAIAACTSSKYRRTRSKQ